MKDKDDKGYVVLGPPIEGGYQALHIDQNGARPGRVYTSREAAPEDVDAKICLERIAGPFHKIVSEEPVGRPAMVNSRAYRNNWDNIFGGKSVIGEA
jgi:hypothetical protein